MRSGSGGSRGARAGRRHRWRQEAAAQLPAAPVEAAANMLLARAGFDLLRSAAFKERVTAQIRRKLALQRVPDYITSLEVRAACTHACMHAHINLQWQHITGSIIGVGHARHVAQFNVSNRLPCPDVSREDVAETWLPVA